MLLVAAQAFDGISTRVIGYLTPLLVADIGKGSRRFNLAQDVVGTFSGIGAAVSTTAINVVAQNFGNTAGFMAIPAMALAPSPYNGLGCRKPGSHIRCTANGL